MARPRIYEEPRIATAVRLPQSLHEELHALAAAKSKSANELMSSAVESYLKRNKKRVSPTADHT